ncbi:MAG TPA: MMPL family transporter [Thermoanaerobaculales bacterium]|nr:MMPL family transporter [Thermoanaerobaculales bacterium]
MKGGLLPRRLPLAMVRLGGRHPRAVVAGAVVACIVAGLLATRVDVETDILSLVPRNNPVVEAFTSTIERFGSVDTLLVVVRIGDGADLQGVLDFADRFARELDDWDQIDWVTYRVERGAGLAAPLLDRATLFLDERQVDRLIDRLDEEALPAEAARIQGALLAPQSMVTKEFLRVDPMGLLHGIIARARFGGVGVTVDPETGCLIDRQRRMLLMVARPAGPAQDLDFDRLLEAGLAERVSRASQAWAADGWTGPPPAVEFTGGYAIALEDSRLITSDAVTQIVSTLTAVLLMFLIAFRRPAALLFAIVPMVTGLGLAVVFVALALGRLNSLTSATGALLIGLGIDYVIVLYGRYVEERQQGQSHGQALDAIGRQTGIGVLLGAATTTATFYAFLFTDFAGLSELGLLTGTGILLLAASVFLLLPALLTIFYGRRAEIPKLSLHSFGSDRLCRAALSRPRATVAVAVLLTVALGAAAFRLSYDDDIQNLRSPDNRGSALRTEVMQSFGLRFTPIMIRVDGRDEFEAMARAREILPELEAMVDGETLASIDTIAKLVPSEAEQRLVIDRLAAARHRLEGVEGRLATAFRDAGLNPVAFDEGIRHLAAALRVGAPLSVSDLKGTALESVANRYVADFPGGVSTVIYCYTPSDRWRRQVPPALAELAARHDWAVLASTVGVSAELRRIVWSDAARAALLGALAVYLLMWADLGSHRKALLALAPLGAGLIWMLGAMAALGVQVNFMNIFVMTMVIGIGVDYGIHLLHRWTEAGADPDALAETSKAIAVAALTTVAGFGSLVLSHFPGLRSVGVAAILGAAFSALASVTLLPAILARLRR